MKVRRTLWIAAFFLGVAIQGGAAESLTKVTFLPQWEPQAQFAGYYMAYEKGLYRRQGLDVSIVRGGPTTPPIPSLAEGKVDFISTFLASALEQRAKGTDLVNIGQIVQRSSLILIAKRSSGIESPADFQGKKISVWPQFDLQPKALFRKFGLQVDIIPQSYTLNLFLRDAVQVVSAMWYNEYHTLLNSGLDEDDLQIFFFHEYGLNFPEDGIYCRRETLQKDRTLCCRFVLASLEGWRYAFDHPDETLDVVMRLVNDANLPSNRMHQRWMLDRMKDIILPLGRENALGQLRSNDYEIVTNELLKSGVISQIPDYGHFYETCVEQP